MHVSDEKRRKLDAKLEKCILVRKSRNKRGTSVVLDESTPWYSLLTLTLDSVLITKDEANELDMIGKKMKKTSELWRVLFHLG